MSITRGRLFVAVAGCVVSWISVTSASSTTPPPAVSIANDTPPSATIASACPSRTINFITETLPQQCLRTDWSSNVTSSAREREAVAVTITGLDGEKDTVSVQSTTDGETSPVVSHESSGATPTSEPSASSSSSSSSHTLEEPASSTPSSPSSASTSDESGDQDEDPLSDAANFVSFEEWKAKMLERAGQSPENLGGERKGEGEGRPRPIHQALDSLEDDGEIELDFGSIVDPDTVTSALPSAKIDDPAEPLAAEPDAVAVGASKLSKNAGTTSKDRTNYASLDYGAQVLKSNSECKGAPSILMENKDNYMLNPCHVKNKFVIVELCNEILIDTIALGNYEFFSSTFRQVRFSISDRYPVKPDKWRVLGVFEAQNRRGVQAFLVENGLIWGRYLRLEFLGHYGSEYYCPVSLLRVHGKTMMDDYRNDFKTAKGDDEGEEELQEDVPEAIPPQQAKGDMQASSSSNGKDEPKGSESAASSKVATPSAGSSESSADVPNMNIREAAPFPPRNCRGPGAFNDTCPRTNYFSSLIEQVDLLTSNCSNNFRFCNQELTKRIYFVSRAAASKDRPSSTPPLSPQTGDSNVPKTTGDGSTGSLTTISAKSAASEPNHPDHVERSASQGSTPKGTSRSRGRSAQSDSEADTSVIIGTASAENTTASSATQATSRTPVQAAPSATPSTQESFFKSVHKRLQLLEANSTLSLQYIEEQSRLLREAFTKVEKRQLSKTTSFLASLNETVLSELREFRTQYDQIWQSTILELSSQREQTLKEASALSVRLAILADEVVWQKRLVYLQFGLILLCLAFFVFVQGSAGSDGQNYLELPMLRDMLTRSPYSSRHGRMRPRASTGISIRSDDRGMFDSLTPSPSRPVSASGPLWARTPASGPESDDGLSDELVLKSQEPEDPNVYRLPTPPSEEDTKPNGLLQVPGAQPATDPEPEVVLRRAISSPALGRDEMEGTNDEDELTSPVEPPRVAELARDSERETSQDGEEHQITTPKVTASNGDTVS